MYNPDKISVRRTIAFISKTFPVYFLIQLLASQQLLAQVADDFTDADFTTNPMWNGSTSDFIVNTSSQLQLNAAAAGTSYLSTNFAATLDDYAWEFSMKQSFAPSGGNFSRFYLVSDQSDLTASLNGYYLQFGEAGSLDAVQLFRQSGSTSFSVCRATNGAIATAFEIRVKVTRDRSGLWQLFIDYTGGNGFILESSGIDPTYSTSSYCGILCTYTITNAARFYYDSITILPFVGQDATPPEILAANVLSATEVNIIFTEAMDPTMAEDVSNYVLSSTDHPATALLTLDRKTVQLVFSSPMQNGSPTTLIISGLQDVSGNTMVTKEVGVKYFRPMPVEFQDIIISEIFADHAPQVGLPAAEFVELYNRSAHPIELNGWSFTDGSSSGVLASFILLPEKYLLLYASGSASDFTPYGEGLAMINFPTLNNSSDRLKILDANGVTIDSVNYSASWYKDEDKQAGGWTLERIDRENSCKDGENWAASMDPSGGTPGKINSVHQIQNDTEGPKLLQAIRISESSVQLTFDEKLSTTPPDPANFSIAPNTNIVKALFPDNLYTTIHIFSSDGFDTTTTYTLSVSNIFDCPGNLIQPGYDKAFLNIDLIRPVIESIAVETSTSISVKFSEKVSDITAENLAHYFIEGLGNPASVMVSADMESVTLYYSKPFVNGKTFPITVRGLADLAGNVIEPTEETLLYFLPHPTQFKDVVITEILADPAPQVDLPDAEFIELFNRSENPLDLSGWIVTDGLTSGLLPPHILLPGEYVILTTPGARTQLLTFGHVLAANVFPGLNNSSDWLILKDGAGMTIDSLKYDLSWFDDEEKAEGGWSLELIDPQNICADKNNWQASESLTGGTPGNQNSVYANNPDTKGPRLLSASALSSKEVTLTFDEKLKAEAPATVNFSVEPLLRIEKVLFKQSSLNMLILSLSDEVAPSAQYQVKVDEVYDCPGNIIDENFAQATLILPEPGLPGDIVVNEILFNPRPTGVDFVEIFNRSDKVINLKNWSIGHLNGGTLENSKVISAEDILIHPKEYRVFSENSHVLKGEYLQGKEENFFQVDLPPFNDESGSVAIINDINSISDSLRYTDQMHTVFLQDDEGVSLERISFNVVQDEAQNWRSASSTVGFATPGYSNSNLRENDLFDDGSVTVEPEIFQPFSVNDDFAQIKFAFEHGGFVANVKIIDQQGRAVKAIAHNALLGTNGFFRWDGDLDDGSRARTGNYQVWFEIFDSGGSLKTYRKRVVLY